MTPKIRIGSNTHISAMGIMKGTVLMGDHLAVSHACYFEDCDLGDYVFCTVGNVVKRCKVGEHSLLAGLGVWEDVVIPDRVICAGNPSKIIKDM